MTKDVIQMAIKSGIEKTSVGWRAWTIDLERFAALVAATEREACAQYLRNQNTAMTDILAKEIVNNAGKKAAN